MQAVRVVDLSEEALEDIEQVVPTVSGPSSARTSGSGSGSVTGGIALGRGRVLRGGAGGRDRTWSSGVRRVVVDAVSDELGYVGGSGEEDVVEEVEDPLEMHGVGEEEDGKGAQKGALGVDVTARGSEVSFEEEGDDGGSGNGAGGSGGGEVVEEKGKRELERLMRDPELLEKRFNAYLERLGDYCSKVAQWDPLPHNGDPFTKPPKSIYVGEGDNEGDEEDDEEEGGDGKEGGEESDVQVWLREEEEERRRREGDGGDGEEEGDGEDGEDGEEDGDGGSGGGERRWCSLLMRKETEDEMCGCLHHGLRSPICAISFDLWQLLGVFMSVVPSPVFARSFWIWGVLGGLVSWDWALLVPSSGGSAFTIFTLLPLSLFFSVTIALFESQVQAAAGDDQARVAEKKGRGEQVDPVEEVFSWTSILPAKRLRVIVHVATLLHLPITATVMKIITCSPSVSAIVAASDEPTGCSLSTPLLSSTASTSSSALLPSSTSTATPPPSPLGLPYSATFGLQGVFGERWECDCYSSRPFLALYLPLSLLSLLAFVVPFPLYLYLGVSSSAPNPAELPAALEEKERLRRRKRAKKHAKTAATLFVAAGKRRRRREGGGGGGGGGEEEGSVGGGSGSGGGGGKFTFREEDESAAVAAAAAGVKVDPVSKGPTIRTREKAAKVLSSTKHSHRLAPKTPMQRNSAAVDKIEKQSRGKQRGAGDGEAERQKRKDVVEEVAHRAAASKAQVRLSQEWAESIAHEPMHRASPFGFLYSSLSPWGARWAGVGWVVWKAVVGGMVVGLWALPVAQAGVMVGLVAVLGGVLLVVAFSRSPGSGVELFQARAVDAWVVVCSLVLLVVVACGASSLPSPRGLLREEKDLTDLLQEAAIQAEDHNGAQWPPEAGGGGMTWGGGPAAWDAVASTSKQVGQKTTIREYMVALGVRVLTSGVDPLAGAPALGESALAVLQLTVVLWSIAWVLSLVAWAQPLWRQRVVEATVAVSFGRFQDKRGTMSAEEVLGLPGAGGAGAWELSQEVPLRLWHSFWDAALTKALQPQPALGNRWKTLRAAAVAAGPSRVRRHAQVSGDESVQALVAWVEEELEGPDAFFDGAADDGSDDSQSHFGSVTVAPYPFHCLFRWDDTPSFARLWVDDLPGLVARNTDPAVLARRLVREQLRALDGQRIPLGDAGYRQENVHFATTDTSSSSSSSSSSSGVSIVHYRFGTVHVVTHNGSDPDSRGFHVAIRAEDGVVGEDRGGSAVTMEGFVGTLHDDDIGLDTSFHLTRKLRSLLWSPEALRLTRQRLPRVQAAAQKRRAERMREREYLQDLLHHDFYHQVYLRPGLPLEEVVAHFQHIQSPDGAGSLLYDPRHRPALQFLARRAHAAVSSPVSTLWFVFFHDLWEKNRWIPRVASNPDLFNPALPSALAYHPTPRHALDKTLASMGLDGFLWGRIAAVLTPFQLDLLYAHLRLLWLGTLGEQGEDLSLPPMPSETTDSLP